MSSIPPSYEEAIRRDPLPLIAPYLSCAELARASVVSRAWNAAFASYLWGHPMRHSYARSGHDPATFAADAFHVLLKSLSRSSDATKALVHTVHIPPGSSSHLAIHLVSLAAVLCVLPSLQSLIASNIGQFDHDTLLQLSLAPPVNIRMLIARNCRNVTERGLSGLILHLPQLQYLDLSYTTAGCAPPVIDAIVQSPAISILRLRRVGLKKTELQNLFTSIEVCPPDQRHPLRSLDVRDNKLDLSGLSLQQVTPDSAPVSRRHYFDTRLYESTIRRHLVNEDLKGVRLLDTEPEGITHLYLSGNLKSGSKSFRDVLTSTRLRVLDIEYDEVSNEDPEHNGTWWDPIVQNADHLASLRTCISALLAFDPTRVLKTRKPSERDDPPAYDVGLQHTASEKPQFISFFPNLTSLTITKVPAVTGANDKVRQLLEELLISCAAAASIPASDSLEQNPSVRRPQPSNPAAAHARQLFVLEEIVLEIDPQKSQAPIPSRSRDPDTDALWDAGREDFSFFRDEKPSLPATQGSSSASRPPAGRQPQAVDLVRHLTAWRTARRNAWMLSREGTSSELAAEHWPGKLKVVVKSQSSDTIVQEDCDPFAAFWDHSM